MIRKLQFATAIVATLFVAVSLSGQELSWVIEGKSAGSDIASRPQSRIDGELNFAKIFIAAPLGTKVVAPCDGVVDDVSVGVLHSLTRLTGSQIEYPVTYDEGIADFTASSNNIYTEREVCVTLGISLSDGRKLYIGGLKGVCSFKSGQKIKRGETIGEVGYAYSKLDEPTIAIAISKYGKSIDPMTPFGIETSFKEPKPIKERKFLTKSEAKEDFTILFDAVDEILPTRRYLIDDAGYDSLRQHIMMRIDTITGDNIEFDDFHMMMRVDFNSIIHDTHINFSEPVWKREGSQNMKQPSIFMGFVNDTLRCTVADDRFIKYEGREIVEANGCTADSLRGLIAKRAMRFVDANVQSNIDYELIFNGFGVLGGDGFTMDVTFADGERKKFPEMQGVSKRVQKMIVPFLNYNRYPKRYDTKMLNDSVAYLGLHSFSLSRVAKDNISAFVDSVAKAKVPNFIVDVRNNNGGEIHTINYLFSLFAQDTLQLNGYNRANKVIGFESFKYSDNYPVDMSPLNDGYLPREGEEGVFFVDSLETRYMPHPTINYSGRLYTLTNERSISAATTFPALVVRSHRGVTVGRETMSAYHYLSALKFANIILPNSTISVRLPIVESHFDSAVNERVPFGRGVLPDYELHLTLDELFSTNGDAVLNYALQLIDEGKYLSPIDPFYEVDNPKKSSKGSYSKFSLFLIIVFMALFTVLVAKKRKKE